MTATSLDPALRSLCLLTTCALTLSSARAEEEFLQKIAPILQQHCISCHSGKSPKGGYSLETKQQAFADGYIESGSAVGSHLLDLVSPANGDAAMPKDGKPLTQQQRNAIASWIDRGAVWPANVTLEERAIRDYDWWSYQPMVQPMVPQSGSDWCLGAIDEFILQKQKQEGLTPAPRAGKRALLRRLSYDVTGLPPTPEDMDRFMASQDPDAWEQAVDKLLASPQYGERWARHWLDVVKYADTHGYDKDKLRPNAWPYRDYVIQSFNSDKPYGQFVREQIAGDVFYPDTPNGIIGLGFIAAGPWDFIGHVEVPESKVDGKVARNLDRDDMVSNAINTFCSVTVQCARCHNHKFDPISQNDYYGLQAIFAALDRAERTYDNSQATSELRSNLLARRADVNRQLKNMTDEISRQGGQPLLDVEARISKLQNASSIRKSGAYGFHSQIELSAETTKWVEIEFREPTEIHRIVLHPCHDEFAAIGSGFGFPVRFQVDVLSDGSWKTVMDQTAADYPNPGLSEVTSEIIGLPVSRIRLIATQLAERDNDYILAIAEIEALLEDGRNATHGQTVHALDSIEAPVRWGRSNLIDGSWAQLDDPDAHRRLQLATSQREAMLQQIRTKEFRAQESELQIALQKVDQQIQELPRQGTVYAATTTFTPQANFRPQNGECRDIRVLHRGNVQQPEEVAVPGFLPFKDGDGHRMSVATTDPQRRAALARWLTSPDHPLVWRSIVNRVWQYHFGQGLVSSPNDFGRMGERPSHPELLDWLAIDFRDNGQSFRRLHKMILMSQTYQQSSQHNPQNAAIDDGNRLLWRANRRRLQAEEIRDSVLQVSGSLNSQMGGPGFYLFELEKTDHSPHFEYHKFNPSDPASHRRSIYRFIVRSQPDPWMSTLDCADSSQSTPQRNETLTALQALSLMNSRFNLVMAERFARRMEAEHGDQEDRIVEAFRLCLQRRPEPGELQALNDYADSHGLPALCRILFNMNEFVFVD